MPKGEDITTKFKVDISDLKKGITEANQQIKLANSEFKKASSGMDDWSKSSEGIKSKLTQLKSVLEAQNSKLKAYQEQLKTAQKYEKDAATNVENLRKALDKAKTTYGDNSTEVKKLEKELSAAEKTELSMKKQVADLTITMNNQEGAVKKTEKEMGNLKGSLEKVEKAEKEASKTGKTVDEVLDEMDDSAKKAGDGFTVMKGALSSLVADGIRKAIDAAKEFATSMIDVAAEVKAQNSQFEQTFGNMADSAEQAVSRVANTTGILETRLKGSATSIYGFARASGADVPEAMSLMETALMAAADNAAYYDRSLEDSTETLQSFLKGNYANDAALGVSATEFTRNAAASELFGKKFNDLTEIQKQQTLLKMVTDAQEVSGAMGQAAREADGWENVQGNLNEAWKQFKAEVGTPVLEALIPVIQNITKSLMEWSNNVDWDGFSKKVGDIANKIKEAFGWIIDNKDVLIAAISGIIAAFVAGKIIAFGTAIAGIAKSIQAAAAAQGIWNAVMAANPIGLIVTAIGLLVAGIVLLIMNWDKVKEAGLACWEAIKNAWNTASEWFNTKVIEPIKNFFSSMWESITGFFSEAWTNIQNVWTTVSEWFNTNVIEPVKNFFSEMGTSISGFFQTAWDVIVSVWTTVAEWFNTNVVEPIKAFFQPLLDFYTQLFQSIWDFIKSVFEVIAQLAEGCWNAIVLIWGVVKDWFNENVITPLTEFFTKLWNTIKTAAQTAWDGIKTIWNVVSNWFNTNIIQPVTKFFSTMWDGIKTAASNTWDGIKNVWNVVSSWFNDNIISPVGNFFSSMWDNLKSGASQAWTGIKNAFSPVTNWFKDTFTKAWTAVKNVFSTGGKIFDGITEGITSTFKTVVNGIIGGINKVVKIPFDGINGALDKIRNISIAGAKPFEGLLSRISVPQIPTLQTGGVLKRGQVGLLEGNGAEAVVPLERNKYWIRAVAKQMKDELQSNVQNAKGTLNQLTNKSNVNNFTQIINAPKTPSRIELYRDARNLLSLKGGSY